MTKSRLWMVLVLNLIAGLIQTAGFVVLLVIDWRVSLGVFLAMVGNNIAQSKNANVDK